MDQSFKCIEYSLMNATMRHLRSDVYHHVSRMRLAHFQSRSTADFMSALTSDMEIVRGSYFTVLLDIYTSSVRLILSVAALFWVSPILGGFVTGHSGSGKSTLLHLVSALNPDYTGAVTLGGTEVRSFLREDFFRVLCYITQEPFLFDDTIYQNVCLFSPVERSRVEQVLEQVGLGNLNRSLPDGLDAQVGENAGCLSGGEKQRIAIARALVRGASVLLLDECTSHLDPDTAAEIERLVMKLDGVTVLLVSHNATDTAKNLADCILRVEDGGIKIV